MGSKIIYSLSKKELEIENIRSRISRGAKTIGEAVGLSHINKEKRIRRCDLINRLKNK